MSFNGENYEIFSWLPAKLLYQISSTSKPCKKLLSETRFVEKQCQNYLIKPQEYLLIQNNYYLRSNAQYLQLCALEKNNSSCTTLSKEFKHLQGNFSVIASSNGLLLCTSYDDSEFTRLFLLNPATKKLLYVDPPGTDMVKECEIDVNRAWTVFICGKNYCDKESNNFLLNYTILLFDIPTWSNYRNVYVLEGDNWVLKKENLYIGSGNVDFNSPVYCTDGLYFLSDASFMQRDNNNHGITPYYILHYDIHNGTSRILALSDEAQDHDDTNYNRIGIFGWEKSKTDYSCFESICLVKVDRSMGISIWIGKIGNKDHTKLSWCRLFGKTMSITQDLGIKCYNFPYDQLHGFTIIEKKLIIAIGKRIYSYYLDDKLRGSNNNNNNNNNKAEKIFDMKGDFDGPYWFSCYSSTLRPCTKLNMKSAYIT